MSVQKENLQKIENSGRIPSPPQVAIKILELDRNPDAGIQDLVDIVESDPAISSQILKFANSPVSGLSRQVTSLRQAVALVGMKSARLISLSFSLMKTESEDLEFDIVDFWRQSVGIAVSCRVLSRMRGLNPDSAFITGLLSKLGWLVVRSADSNAFHQIVASQKSLADIHHEALRFYGKTLYQIGASKLKNWHIPEEIYAVIDQASDNDFECERTQVLLLANCFAEILIDDELAVPITECRAKFEEHSIRFGEFSESFEETYQAITKEFVQYLKLANMKVPQLVELGDLEQQAHDLLTEISLQTQIENAALETENQRLSVDANTDQLTGLGNRRAFELRADEEIARELRIHRGLGFLVIDIDKFKSFNDAHGHLAGDHVLKTVAKSMDAAVRKYDIVFRYGGEEFVILVCEADFEDILMVAERVRKAVEKTEIEFENKILKVTISVGVAYFNRTLHSSWSDLFIDADKQVYNAKKQGRNMVCAADADSNPIVMGTANSHRIPFTPSTNT